MKFEVPPRADEASLTAARIPVTKDAAFGLGGESPLSEGVSRSLVVNHLQEVLIEIQQDERYQKNIEHGRPRRGHPEGKVGAHIRELESNLRKIEEYLSAAGTPLDPVAKATLEILIHVHDSFKAEAQPRVRIDDPRSHASIAREFLSTKLEDPSILAMVQLHDVPWSLFQQFRSHGNYDRARLEAIPREIQSMDTFVLFQIVDNTTVGKVNPASSPIKWFISESAPLFETSLNFLAIASFMEEAVSGKLK